MKNIFVFILSTINLLIFATSTLASNTEERNSKKPRLDQRLETYDDLDEIIARTQLSYQGLKYAAENYVARQNIERACEIYELLLSKYYNVADAKRAALLNAYNKNFSRACELYDRVPLSDISSMRSAMMANKYNKTFTVAIKIGQSITANSCTIQDHLNLASILQLNSNYNQAGEIFNAIPIESIIKNNDRLQAASSSLSSGDFDRAKKLYKLVISDEGHTLIEERWIAQRFYILQDYQNASAISELTLKKAPHNVDDLMKAAKYNLLNNNRRRAHELARAVLEHPNCTDKMRALILEKQRLFPIVD